MAPEHTRTYNTVLHFAVKWCAVHEGKKHAQKQQKTNKHHTPQALQSRDFLIPQVEVTNKPRFQVTYRSKPYPQLTSSICHRKSDGATPKCRAKDASCVFLSPNQELPSGQRALGTSQWKRLHEISFSDMICNKFRFHKTLGWDWGTWKPFENLEYHIGPEMLWYVWLGAKLQNFTKTRSLQHQPAERFPAGWWWVGHDLDTKKKTWS